MAAPCRKTGAHWRAGPVALGVAGFPGGWLMSPAPFPVVAECEYQQPCHRQRHADQQPQAWRVCTRVGQLRRFTVQNGKGHGVGVVGLRKLVSERNYLPINRTRAVLGKFDHNWLCTVLPPCALVSVRRYVPGSRFVNTPVILPSVPVVPVMESVFVLSNL